MWLSLYVRSNSLFTMPSGCAVTKQSEVDVLIIGAGPAGLMACHALAKSGINVRIVDKRRAYVYPEMRFTINILGSNLLHELIGPQKWLLARRMVSNRERSKFYRYAPLLYPFSWSSNALWSELRSCRTITQRSEPDAYGSKLLWHTALRIRTNNQTP